LGRPSGAFPAPPIILISIDTLRADHLPAYGYRGVDTPALDRLRKDAILFENAYSHCPLTLPAHVSMLTGLLPPEHEVRNNIGYRFDGKAHPTLAGLLRTRGYATGAAVSAYVVRADTGLSDSFDFYDDAIEKPPDVQAASRVQRKGEETVRRGLAWLTGVEKRPFFLFIHLYEPHSPYEPPEPYRSRYRLAYDGEVAASDAILGAFFDELKRRDLYDRALVLLVSDHGEGLGDHGEDEHGILLYREVLHVPLLMKLPRSKDGGSSVQRPVQLIDVLPTIAAAIGATPPSRLKGASLLERGSEARRVYSETFYPRIHLGWSELRSLVDERYHFIDGPRPELYDVARDQAEKENLLSQDSEIARARKRDLNGYAAKFSMPGQTSPEDLKKLAALGYLSVTSPSAKGGVFPNPADQIPLLEEIKKAFRLAAQGEGERAVRALGHLLEKNPNLFDVQYELGETLSRLKRYEEAAEAYKRAMALSPSLAAEIGLALGRVTLELGRLDEAEANGRLALGTNPPEAHELLARVALARGDLEMAQREANLIRGSPVEAKAAVLLAEVHLRRNEIQQAMLLLDMAIARLAEQRLRPVGNLHFLRGDSLARLGRYPEAEAAFKEEIRFFPTNSHAYARLAIVYAVERRTARDVYRVLEAMQRAHPTRETSLLAAETLASIGDRRGAGDWRRRAGVRSKSRSGD
jgi:arylsulfatase A-like enzyme/Flp pilus assembly protein TadD